MPTTLTCPNCRATLTAKQPVPAGKSIACPKCKAAFTAPADDDLPDAVLVDEPAPPRASRRDENEDDDRPRARRKVAPVDDEDDRPRSRRSREDDEDDERPRALRSRRDEDDEDRPVRRRKKRVSPLVIVLPIAAVVLFVAIGLGVYFLFLGGGGVPQPDLVAWAPADATTVTYLDYQTLRNNPNVDQTDGFGLGRVPLYGLDPGQVDGVLLTGQVFKSVRVIRLKKADAAAIDQAIASQGGQEIKVAGKSTFRTGKVTLYRASDRLLVACDDADYLTKRIGNDEGKVVVSGPMKDFLGRASGTIWTVTVAGNGTMTVNGDRVEGSMKCITLSGGGGEESAETVYADSAAAARAADQANAAYARMNLGQVTRSGRRLTYKGPVKGNVSMMEFVHGIW